GQTLADRIKRLDKISRSKLDHLVAHPEMACYGNGIRRLIKTLIEALGRNSHGERSQIGGGFGRKCGDQTGIKPTGEKDPDRHIGDDLAPHRAPQQIVEMLGGLAESHQPLPDWRPPIALDCDPSLTPGQYRAGFDPFDPDPSGTGAR